MKKNRVNIYIIVISIILICFLNKMIQDTDIQKNDYSDIIEIADDEDRMPTVYCQDSSVNIIKDDYSDIIIEIADGEGGMATIYGQNSAVRIFQIDLNYSLKDIILGNTYFIDFTGDSKKELCLEMNIWNSVSSDLNTIMIYDIENDKILFPTSDKSFIYNGYIEQFEEDDMVKNLIIYSSYTKFNGISIEDESSIVVWNDYIFDTMEYQNKLLVATDEYIVFYKKSSPHDDTSFKLFIFDPNTLEVIQELELMIDEVNITRKISEQKLVTQINNESYDLLIEDYGILYWDEKLKEFWVDMQ